MKLQYLVSFFAFIVVFIFYPIVSLTKFYYLCIPIIGGIFFLDWKINDKSIKIPKILVGYFLFVSFFALISIFENNFLPQSYFFIVSTYLIALIIFNFCLNERNDYIFFAFGIPLIFTIYFFYTNSDIGRFSSYFTNSNTFGLYLNILLILILYKLFLSTKYSFILYTLLGLTVFFGVLSGSRKTIIGLFIEFLIFVFFYFKFNFKKGIQISFIASFLIFIIILNIDLTEYYNYFERIFRLLTYLNTGSSSEGSINERKELAERAFILFSQKPFFGWGLDTFRTISGFGKYAHNNYLELLSNTGIIGTASYYIMLLSHFFIRYWEQRKIKSYPEQFLLTASFLLILFLDLSIVTYYNLYVFILIIYIEYILKKNEAKNSLYST